MKKILILFLLTGVLTLSASIQDTRDAVTLRGYDIISENYVATDSGGELARGFVASKNGKMCSIFVEVNSFGDVIVFDVLVLS